MHISVREGSKSAVIIPLTLTGAPTWYGSAGTPLESLTWTVIIGAYFVTETVRLSWIAEGSAPATAVLSMKLACVTESGAVSELNPITAVSAEATAAHVIITLSCETVHVAADRLLPPSDTDELFVCHVKHDGTITTMTAMVSVPLLSIFMVYGRVLPADTIVGEI